MGNFSTAAGTVQVEPSTKNTSSLPTSLNIGTLPGDVTSLPTEETHLTDLTPCLNETGHLNDYMDTYRTYYAIRRRRGIIGAPFMTCTLTVTARPGRRFLVQLSTLWLGICHRRNYIRIFDGQNYDEWSNDDCGSPVLGFQSDGNNVTLDIHVVEPSSSYDIRVDVYAMAAGLEVIDLSPTQGFIQSPGNDLWRRYWESMDTWQQIFPPQDHTTLLSMSRLDVGSCREAGGDLVRVFQGGRVNRDLLWEVCGSKPPLPELLDTREIHVHFKSDNSGEFFGFRLLFSFHEEIRQPRRVDACLWNCSLPEWPDFERHFLCNLDVECEGGEDEAGCFYTGRCGQGYVTLHDSCYRYMSAKQLLSWEEANLDCTAQSGHLASLNTPMEWEVITEFLKTRASPRHVLLGLKSADPTLSIWYKYSYEWADGSIAFFRHVKGKTGQYCGSVSPAFFPDVINLHLPCTLRSDLDYLCEFASRGQKTDRSSNGSLAKLAITFATLPRVLLPVPHVECPAGHLTLDFLACDEQSACWAGASCSAPMTSLPAMFVCSSGGQLVPYSMVCDFRQQCADGSDEGLCVFPPCSGPTPLQCATSAQCVGHDEFCDSVEHCVDRSDESDCLITGRFSCHSQPPPAALNYYPRGQICRLFSTDSIAHHHGNPAVSCPHTHFQCHGDGYCLPAYLRCNMVKDCPGGEDEADCDAFVCPGFYRCRGSMVCLHVRFVCDELHHCPEQDDELYCHSSPCPHNCTCHGLAYKCNGTFAARSHRKLRYLDAKGSGLGVDVLSVSSMLVYLSLARCGLQTVGGGFSFPNLRNLDLSDNFITVVSAENLRDMANLQLLILSGNPLSAFSESVDPPLTMDHLESMDLSFVTLNEIDFHIFAPFPNLLRLNLSHSNVRTLYRRDNQSLRNIRVLDMRGSHVINFQRDIVLDFVSFETLFAENYKLCCPVILPPMFNPKNCHAPSDRVSSCDHLLSSAGHRILLALCCGLALLGNVTGIVLRVCAGRSYGFIAEDVFVTHVAVSDVVMGVCTAVVVVADRVYQGRYALEDATWRQSIACKTVGFLYLLSTQVSVGLVFLATLDRLISLFFSARRLSFKPISVRVLCLVAWAWCTVLAALPLMPTNSQWKLLGQTGVCLPLFATGQPFAEFASSTFTVIVVVFSFVLTLFTGASQIVIHTTFQNVAATRNSVQRVSSTPAASLLKSDEVSRARRVFSSCVLNVACWLALCVLAVLAWVGSPLSDEMHVLVGMTTAPMTSALRPFLYALAVRGENRRRKRAERLMAHIIAQRGFKKQNDNGRTEK